MTLQLGTGAVNKMYLGDTEIKKAHLGDTLVYDKTGGAPVSMPASTVFQVHATMSDCYPGSGQTLATLDKDGAALTAYDFYLGATSSASTDDPTFNGTAGDSAAYFSFDGGDKFKMQVNPPTTFLQELGKNTQDFWIAFAGRTETTVDASWWMFGCNGLNPYPGMRFQHSNSSTGSFGVATSDGTAARQTTFPTTETVSPDTDFLVIISCDVSETTNNIKCWINEKTSPTSIKHTFSGATNTDYPYYLCGTDGFNIRNGMRFYGFAIGNAFIGDTEVGQIVDYFNAAHGRTYA